MTVEVDPDFTLGARLAAGRGWKLVAAYALGPVVAALLIAYRVVWAAPVDASRLMAAIAFAAALMLPLTTAGRLADQDRRGLLEVVRLGGRPPRRVLIALFAGWMTPSLAFMLPVATVGALFGEIQAWPVVLVTLATLELQLIALGSLSSATSPLANGVLLLVGASGCVALAFSGIPGWSLEITTRVKVIATMLVAAGAPFALQIGSRLVIRPHASSPAGRRFWLRTPWLPAGPPEFSRRLRSAAAPAVALTVIGAAVLVTLVAVTRYHLVQIHPLVFEVEVQLIAYVVIGAGAVLIWYSTREDLAAGAIDLVRLTPQTPAAVIAGWYGGVTLPFLIGTLALAFAATNVLHATASFHVATLVQATALVIAIALAESLEPSAAGMATRYIGLAVVFICLGVRFPSSRNSFIAPSSLNPRALMSSVAIGICLAAASGRFARRNGPVLSAPAAAATMIALAFATRIVAIGIYPRVVIAVLGAFAPLVAEERTLPTLPWRRVAFAAVAAGSGAAAFAAEGGLGIDDVILTGGGAALAVASGVLWHEMAHWSGIFAAAPAVLLAFGLLRSSAPVALRVLDIAALLAAFIVLGIVHTRARAHSGASRPAAAR